METFNAEMLDAYAQASGWMLARAHAKASEISATISGYLGSSNDAFDIAMGKFALANADQAERDLAALKTAVKKGRIVAARAVLRLAEPFQPEAAGGTIPKLASACTASISWLANQTSQHLEGSQAMPALSMP